MALTAELMHLFMLQSNQKFEKDFVSHQIGINHIFLKKYALQTVVIRTFDNYFKANIILTRLQHSGIDCFLKDEYTVTIDPLLSNAIGGIKLAVSVEDAEIAEKLLQQFEEEYLRSAVCPKCSANDIRFVHEAGVHNYITAFLTRLFPGYSVATKNVYKCLQCGYESKTLPENLAAYN